MILLLKETPLESGGIGRGKEVLEVQGADSHILETTKEMHWELEETILCFN